MIADSKVICYNKKEYEQVRKAAILTALRGNGDIYNG